MLDCISCHRWYHGHCVNITYTGADCEYNCNECTYKHEVLALLTIAPCGGLLPSGAADACYSMALYRMTTLAMLMQDLDTQMKILTTTTPGQSGVSNRNVNLLSWLPNSGVPVLRLMAAASWCDMVCEQHLF